MDGLAAERLLAVRGQVVRLVLVEPDRAGMPVGRGERGRQRCCPCGPRWGVGTLVGRFALGYAGCASARVWRTLGTWQAILSRRGDATAAYNFKTVEDACAWCERLMAERKAGK